MQLSEIGSHAAEHFGTSSTFSGALIPNGTGVLILENDFHATTRRRSTLCHELAHVLLEHTFGVSLTAERTCQTGRPDVEEEADWFAGEILVSQDAAYHHAFEGTSDAEVALAYEVSPAMAQWRMNHTGARRVAARKRGLPRLA